MKKNTIKEVAKAAGVSIATVSRVINGKDRVKTSTRLRVEEAISKLNYQPDLIARTMIIKETKTIGLVVPQLSNEYWAILSEVIQEELWLKGYTLILCSTDRRIDHEIAFIEMFMERKVDGIIFGSASMVKDTTEKYFEQVRQSGIPIVALDQRISGMDMVIGDHLQGAADAVEHLISLGHQEIAYLGGPAISIERKLGFYNAFIKHGMQVNNELVNDQATSKNFTQFGYDAIKELLLAKQSFTAVFCGNDLVAIGAIKSLEESGMRVPDDVAVIGYDDISMARLYKPALTTVSQPIRDIGKAAVDLLVESIKTGKVLPPRKTLFHMQLVVRESCGANTMSTEKK
ncbi:LacI family transcriptional regulator [Paenibacillaceae bacterium]|nr:LacI family transcriptional regulator [Paenibacillaceae bacterium]